MKISCKWKEVHQGTIFHPQILWCAHDSLASSFIARCSQCVVETPRLACIWMCWGGQAMAMVHAPPLGTFAAYRFMLPSHIVALGSAKVGTVRHVVTRARLSFKKVPIDTPTDIDTKNAAYATQAEGSHEPHLRADPPPDRAQYRYPNKNKNIFHNLVVLTVSASS